MCALPYKSHSPVKNILYKEFKDNKWFNELLSYITTRYYSIETRIIDTFRFVELHPMNSNVFSYEYGSILRDAGSVFGSIMDKLVRATNPINPEKILDMTDYKKWLKENVEKIHLITAGIRYPIEKRFLMPFISLQYKNKSPEWWRSYNYIKHLEIDKFTHGNLGNALNSLAALAILYALMDETGGAVIRLFDNIGFFEPENSLKKLLFS